MFNQISSGQKLKYIELIQQIIKTTLTEFNHPPDWGSDFIIEGKAAKSVNGSPSPTPKPNIAIFLE